MRTLRGAPAGAVTPEQHAALRDAGDELVLAGAYDAEARRALAEARHVLSGLRRPEHEPWVDQLAADLEDCGPIARPVAVSPAVGPIPAVVVQPGRRGADR